MLKKVIGIVGISALILWSASCSLIDKTATPSSSQTVTTVSPQSSDGTFAPSVDPTASTDVTDSAAPSDDAEATTDSASPSPIDTTEETDLFTLGEALIKSDGVGAIKINMSESDLVEAIGEPKAKSSPEFWGADGLNHSDWDYEGKGLVINMAESPETKTYIVFSIKAIEPCTLKTARGIAIGDTKAEVLKAYAKEYDAASSDEYSLVLGSVFGGMIISVDGGVVVEIFVGAAAE